MATTQPITLNETDNYLDNIISDLDEQEKQEQANTLELEQENQKKEQEQEKKDFEKSIFTEKEFVDSMMSIMAFSSERTGLDSLNMANYGDFAPDTFKRIYLLCKDTPLLQAFIKKTESKLIDVGMILYFIGTVSFNCHEEIKQKKEQKRQETKQKYQNESLQSTAVDVETEEPTEEPTTSNFTLGGSND